MKELSKFLVDFEKTLVGLSKNLGPILFTLNAIIWLLALYIYFRGIKAYLREKGKVMTIAESDKLEDLAFIGSRTDEEEKELKLLKAKRDELKKESVLPYYIGSIVLLVLAVLTLTRIDLVIMWLKGF